MKHITLIFSSAMLSFISSSAQAWDPFIRCNGEWTSDEAAFGRNAWALKCGAISKKEHNSWNESRQFVTFAQMHAPYDRNAPCDGDWGRILGTCVFGCYIPSQTLIFDGKSMSIDEAMNSDTKKVTSLESTTNWHQNPKALKEEAIDFFVSGQNADLVIRIVAEAGDSITVTRNHPMVTASGEVIIASKVEPGQTVLQGVQGPMQIKSVEYQEWEGPVLNVSPVSKTVEANLIVAEGFIVGSSRFQNEWAHDQSRLFFRETISIPQDD